jgi:hypothetical protein
MVMGIDEAGQNGLSFEVDHSGPGAAFGFHKGSVRSDGYDLFTFNSDRLLDREFPVYGDHLAIPQNEVGVRGEK